MKLRLLLLLVTPFLFLSACQKTNHQKPVHHKTKIVKKIVYVHHKHHNYKNSRPVPSIAKLRPKRNSGMPQYRMINKPVVVLTFHNKNNESAGTQMTKYLNSIVNLNQYHVQVSATGNTIYVTLRQMPLDNNY